VAAVLVLVGAGCGGRVDADDEVGQAVGDVMASFDEAGEGGGLALRGPGLRRDDLTRPGGWDRMLELAVPSAHAETASPCLTTARLTACSSGVRTRSFDGCGIGSATLFGAVTLTFSDATCRFPEGASVTRTADFGITGPRGAELRVSSPGGGQKVTRTADGATYAVLGLNRTLTSAAGRKLLDLTARTTTDISVRGTSRANRVFTGGSLQVVDQVSGRTMSLSPKDVTWTAGCPCATSGRWEGTVSAAGEAERAFVVELNGCGRANVTVDGASSAIELDRCGGAI
jgi:hypothetical protein